MDEAVSDIRTNFACTCFGLKRIRCNDCTATNDDMGIRNITIDITRITRYMQPIHQFLIQTPILSLPIRHHGSTTE